jgi:hypothetical protein
MPGESMTTWDLLEPDTYSLSIVSPTPWKHDSTPVTIVPGQTVVATIKVSAR